MSSIDQLEVIIARDCKERIIIDEDEVDVPPRNHVLETKYYSQESGVSEQSRTALLNHMIQFRTKFQVCEFTILHTYYILEAAIRKLSISRQDLEKYSMSCLLISLKFKGQFSGRIDQFCELCSDNFTVRELFSIERKILMTLDFRLHLTTPSDIVHLISNISGELSKTTGSNC